MRQLLNGCASCLNPPRKLEPHTLQAILLLLYGAGLRIGEAVALTVADVNVPNSLLTIRNSKFHKTRLVPLGSDLTPNYCAVRHRQAVQRPFDRRYSAFFRLAERYSNLSLLSLSVHSNVFASTSVFIEVTARDITQAA